MTDPFAAALAVLHGSVGAVAAIYTASGGSPIELRVIRHCGTREVTSGGTPFLADTNLLQIRRSDVDLPADGDEVVIGTEVLLLQGGPSLDARGLYWTCPVEPAPW